MAPMEEALVTITEEEMNSLTQSILTRYGIDFTCYEPKSLKRRIIRVLSVFKLQSVHELWVKFLKEQNFIYSFMNEISVGMTSMFRDPFFWVHLKRILRDNFSNAQHINIWHAGCSTGEEVYSMAIVLKELGFLSKTKAWATDINQDAIETAKKGEYHKIKKIENERNFHEYNRLGKFEQYFTDGATSVTMNPELIKHVEFGYHNLITDPVAKKFDIILCRNVMIYFDTPAKRNLVQKFYNALNPTGLFVIGFYDTMLTIIDQKLFTFEDEEAKIFRKECDN
jgi:chemotaxis protein methyltransferase CheR